MLAWAGRAVHTRDMRTRTVLIGTAAAIAVLAVVFLVVGLSTADQLASTVGALAGVGGLGLALVSTARERAARRQAAGDRRVGEPAAPAPGPGQDAAPGGVHIVARNVFGVVIGHRGRQNNVYGPGAWWWRLRNRRLRDLDD